MKFDSLVIETRGHVRWIRLARPKAMNALSPELVDELDRAFASVEHDA